MVTTLGEYDINNEVFVACPSSILAESKRFKKARNSMFPQRASHLVYSKYCSITKPNTPYMECTRYVASQDIYILSVEDVQVVNAIGLESLPNIRFYKVPNEYAYCLTSTKNDCVDVDESRFIIKELQKQYNIPESVLKDIKKRICGVREHVRAIRLQYDSDDEEDMEFWQNNVKNWRAYKFSM